MYGLAPRLVKCARCRTSKNQIVSNLWLLLLIWALGTWTGCAGVSANSPSTVGSQVSITIFPTSATVESGGSLQFKSTVNGTIDSGVTWTTTAGSISSTGLLTAPAVASETVLRITATSRTDNQSTASAAVTVTTSSPSISTTSLPPATLGMTYSTTLQGTGGVAPYQWSMVSGSLPTELLLNTSTGEVSGIPTVVEESSFVVQLTDQDGRSAQQSLTLAVSTASNASCGPPTYNCSRTDFNILIPTAPPQLGSDLNYYGGHVGAGVVAIDPAYGNRILRVTDGSTDTSNPGMTFGTSWSPEANLISSDESLFFVTNEGNTPCLFQFDPNAFQAAFHGCHHHSGAGNLQFGYTSADASTFYNYNGLYLYRFVIDRSTWGISPDAAFNQGQGYFDPDGPQCLSGELAAGGQWYVQDTSLSSDDSTFIAEMGPQQDADPYVVVWNASKGCRWMNVVTWEVSAGWNTGLSNPVKISWVSGTTPKFPGGLHNVELDRSGQYAVLTINGTSLPSKVFWDVDTNVVNDTCVHCWSHWACDFGVCFWSFGPSDRGFEMRDLTIAPSTDMSSMMGNRDTPLISSTVGWVIDEHVAHQNAVSGQTIPYLVEVSQDSGAFTVGHVWEDELIAVNWDGSMRTVRFNKTWSSGFAGCPISRLGHFAICGSDYQMYNIDRGFGSGLNLDTCDHTLLTGGRGTTACRHDVLLFELR
jgi:hypothetical protein